jgi:hypothetical protein
MKNLTAKTVETQIGQTVPQNKNPALRRGYEFECCGETVEF